MMQRMQQANAVDSTDGEQQVQGKEDWQQKADLNAIFSNGSRTKTMGRFLRLWKFYNLRIWSGNST